MMEEGNKLYMTCAFGAGCTAVFFGSPFDFCTTRHMNNPGKFTGPIDVMMSTFKHEGPTAFYKGVVPNIARLGGFNVVLWMTYESIKKHYL